MHIRIIQVFAKIAGDTDSIMINTRQTDPVAVRKIGEEVVVFSLLAENSLHCYVLCR